MRKIFLWCGVGVLLVGCETLGTAPIEKDPLAVLRLGRVTTYDRESSYVLSAPHGGFDRNSEVQARIFCELVPWDCIIAEGFRQKRHPYNVNRPTEGVAKRDEKRTPEAETIFYHFVSELRKIQAKSPLLYVELHGSTRPASQPFLEIATVGVDREVALAIKRDLTAELAAAGITDLTVLIEGDSKLFYRASSAKQGGTLSLVPVAMHIEVPLRYGEDSPEVFGRFLSKALPQIAQKYFSKPKI